MVVLYVPQDTRWGDLGKGLGQMLGAVAGNVWDQHVTSDIAKMQQDPMFKDDPNGLLQAVSSKYGPGGIKSLNTLNDSKVKIAQLNLTGQETDLDKARTGLAQLDLAIKTEAKPEEIAQIKANLAHTLSQTHLAEAETAFTAGPRTAQAAATTAETQARIPGTVATSRIAGQEAAGDIGASRAQVEKNTADLARQNNEFVSTMLKPNPGDPMADGVTAYAKQSGITDPSEIQEVRNAITSNVKDAPAAAAKAVEEIIKRHHADTQQDKREAATAEGRKTLAPTEMRNSLDNANSMLVDFAPFLEPGAAKGFLGNVEAWAISKGFGTDPQMMRALAAQNQAQATFIDGGRGFGGSYRQAVGKQVLQNVGDKAVFNLMHIEEIAKKTLAVLQTNRDELGSLPKYKDQVDKWNESIDKYNELLKQTGELWWLKEKDSKGQRTGKVHWYYRGYEVDANLKPLTAGSTALDPNANFQLVDPDTGTVHTYTGREIYDRAKIKGVMPTEALRALQNLQQGQGQQ